jgi:outer membrane protein OmpA-like peptidoglycan-associated protein
MRSRCLVLSGSSAVLTSLSLWAPQLMAQDALAASVAVESSHLALEAPTLDTGGEGDYLHRYKPQANTVELGAFAGMLFLSDENSFRGPPAADGTPAPYSEYKQPSAELGVRVGYFPLTFLGGELEGMLGLLEADRGDAGTLWAGRVHVVAQAPFWSVVPFVVGGAGYWALSNGTSGSDNDPAFHFGGGVKLAANDDLSFRVDVRDTITNQRAVGDVPNTLEVNAGASLVLGRSKPAPPDSDGDGILNGQDACPTERGALPDGCPARDRDGDQIVDGDDQCPDQSGPAPTGCALVDADADGIFDDNDQCLNEPGLAPSGCPDRDGDGVFDRQDQCPTVAGLAPLGCPADTDRDGLVDPEDKCPAEPESKNGFEDTDGCPDALPEAAKQFNGVIAGIEFDLSKATVRSSSFQLLNQAAKLLQEYPSLRVEITGHTDDTGSHERNLELSSARAESVKSYLVAQGVGHDRIQTRGAGPDEPLVKEKTRVARQKNRRIEFRVLK